MERKTLTANPTQEDLEYEKLYRIFLELKNQIKSDCKKNLYSVKLKFHYLKTHPNTKLPSELDYNTTIECFDEAIFEFERLIKKRHDETEIKI